MGQISSIGGADSASVHDFALDSQHAATKTDVNALRLDVTSEIGALRAENTALRAEIRSVRSAIELSASESRLHTIRSIGTTERWIGSWLLLLTMLTNAVMLVSVSR